MLASRPCKPCASRGIDRAATRVMDGGMGKCESCWKNNIAPLAPIGRDQVKAAAAPPAREALVTARKQVDWNLVQVDRSNGMPVSEICKKYGVSNPSVYTKTTGAKKVRGGGAGHKAGRELGKAARPAARTNGEFASVLTDLRTRREKLDRAIGAIEELNG